MIYSLSSLMILLTK